MSTRPIAVLRRHLGWLLGALVAVLLILPTHAVAKGKKKQGDTLVDLVLGRSAGADPPDTTTLREEFKVTVSPRSAEAFRQEMQKIGGQDFRMRDPQPERQDQVTSTEYQAVDSAALAEAVGLPPGRLENSISAKIRLRKYRSKDGKVSRLTMVEIKMPHPEIPGVTLKPRLLATDAQVKALNNPSYMKSKKNRRALIRGLMRTAQVASGGRLAGDKLQKTERLVTSMVKAIGTAQSKRDNIAIDDSGRVASEVNIEYRRKAYQMPLRIGGRDLDVQFTFDDNIEFRQEGSPDVRVLDGAPQIVEVKVPMPYAKMTEKDLAKRIKELKGRRSQLRRGLSWWGRRKLDSSRQQTSQDDLARVEEDLAGYQKLLRIRKAQGKKLVGKRMAGFELWRGKHYTFGKLGEKLVTKGQKPGRESKSLGGSLKSIFARDARQKAAKDNPARRAGMEIRQARMAYQRLAQRDDRRPARTAKPSGKLPKRVKRR